MQHLELNVKTQREHFSAELLLGNEEKLFGAVFNVA